jgi:hypothetical protein
MQKIPQNAVILLPYWHGAIIKYSALNDMSGHCDLLIFFRQFPRILTKFSQYVVAHISVAKQ